MSFKLKMEGIIQHNIFTERNIINWNEYKNNIIKNFNNINFTKKNRKLCATIRHTITCFKTKNEKIIT